MEKDDRLRRRGLRASGALLPLALLLAGCGRMEGPAPLVSGGLPPPPPVQVTVERGQTLSGIARAYHVPMSALAEANRLSPPYLIRVGQALIIPGSGEAPPRAGGGDDRAHAAVIPVCAAAGPCNAAAANAAALDIAAAGFARPPATGFRGAAARRPAAGGADTTALQSRRGAGPAWGSFGSADSRDPPAAGRARPIARCVSGTTGARSTRPDGRGRAAAPAAGRRHLSVAGARPRAGGLRRRSRRHPQ